MSRDRIVGNVTTDGDTLVYKITGSGTPILFIAGGGGDGDLYLPLADELADDFKVITYDRRANAKSTMNFPDRFDITQQARDAVSILEAAGEPSAFVFGNSSGAVIALEMAKLFPENVIGVIAHEPPIAKMHPDCEKWRKFFRDCYDRAFGFGGASIAATKFMFGIEVPAMQMIRAQMKAMQYLKNETKMQDEKRIPSKLASQYLIEQELIPITDYDLDISAIQGNTEKYIFAVGQYAEKNNTFLFQIVKSISEKIGKPYAVVSGHHGSFMDDTVNWANDIHQMITQLGPAE